MLEVQSYSSRMGSTKNLSFNIMVPSMCPGHAVGFGSQGPPQTFPLGHDNETEDTQPSKQAER